MKIIHISDLHIKNNLTKENVKELNSIYKNLFVEIHNQKADLVVITGDIFHSKTQLSPESVDYIGKLFDILHEQVPMSFVILGNHDCSISNENRKNGIDVILKMKQYDNVLLLAENEVKEYKGLSLYVYPMTQGTFRNPQLNNNNINVCLYHGVISGAKNEFGFVFDHGLETNIFDKFDAVLLGDIHKRQMLSKRPLMAYAGSLHSLTYGDSPISGGLIWNVNSKDDIGIEEFNVHNDYAHVTITDEMSDNDILKELNNYKHPKIRLKFSDLIRKEEIESLLSENVKYSELVFSKQKEKEKEKLSKIKEENYTSVSVQNELIRKYCKEIYSDELSEKEIDELVDRNNEIEDVYGNTEKSKANKKFGNIKLKKIKFINFQRYKGENELDFENKRGIIGILGPNAIGKSSLIDLIRFGIDGTVSKNIDNHEIINYKSTKCEVKTFLSINDIDYVIERTLEKRTNKNNEILGTSSTVILKDLTNNINLTADDVNQTKTRIKNLIGTGEELENNSIMNQNNWQKITSFTDSKRKELIYQIFQLDVFADKLALNKKYKAELDREFDILNNRDHKLLLKKIKDRIKEITSDRVKLLEKQEIYNNAEKEIKDQIDKLYKKLKPISNDLVFHEEGEIERLSRQINELDRAINQLNIDKKNEKESTFEFNEDLQPQLKTIEDEIDKRTRELEEFDEQTLEENSIKFKEITDKILSNKSALKTTYSLFEKQKREYDNLENNGVDLEKCKDCYAIKSIYESYNSLKQELIAITGTLEQLQLDREKINTQEKLDKLNSIKEAIGAYMLESKEIKAKLEKEIEDSNGFEEMKALKLNNIESKISELISKKETTFYNKEQLIKDNKKYEDQLIITKENEQINKEIDRCNQSRREIQDNMSVIMSSLGSLNRELEIKEEEKEEEIKALTALEEISKKVKIAEYYNKLFHKNGLPRYIMENSIESINNTIKELLSYVVDFNVEFRIDDKDNIKIDLIEDGKILSIGSASGMQSILSEFAIRNALTDISKTNKYNFMVVDEAFSALDDKRYSSLNAVMNFIRDNYDFTLLISHDQKTKDLVDDVIEITDVEGISRIE